MFRSRAWLFAAFLTAGSVTGHLSPAQAQQTGTVEDCDREVSLSMDQMRAAAQQCGAQARDLASIDAGSFGSPQKDCSAPIVISGQADALAECARLYYCAMTTLKCVSETARRVGYCSQQFSLDCMAQHPIPSQ